MSCLRFLVLPLWESLCPLPNTPTERVDGIGSISWSVIWAAESPLLNCHLLWTHSATVEFRVYPSEPCLTLNSKTVEIFETRTLYFQIMGKLRLKLKYLCSHSFLKMDLVEFLLLCKASLGILPPCRDAVSSVSLRLNMFSHVKIEAFKYQVAARQFVAFL